MIIKTPEEIEILREGGRKLAAILEILKKEARPGIKTRDLDLLAEKLIRESGGEPSFKGYKTVRDKIPYPASICVSIDDEVVHGLPSERIIKEGDIVGLDIGIRYKRLYTDMAETLIIGDPATAGDEIGKKLVKVTQEALGVGISKVRPGARVGDIGEAIQSYVESNGFGVVRKLVGHGVGYKVHEEPEIPNFGKAGTGPELQAGMVIAIEPMVTEGSHEVFLAEDGWTWKTSDKKRAAHFEHTLVVRKRGAGILTRA